MWVRIDKYFPKVIILHREACRTSELCLTETQGADLSTRSFHIKDFCFHFFLRILKVMAFEINHIACLFYFVIFSFFVCRLLHWGLTGILLQFSVLIMVSRDLQMYLTTCCFCRVFCFIIVLNRGFICLP